MSEKNLRLKVALLRLSSDGRAGVSLLARTLGVGPAGLIGLLSEMRDQGLIELGQVRTTKVGRPRRLVRATALGKEYAGAYESLNLKTLRSRGSDLRKAAADGEYALRLASAEVSTYGLFLELNGLVKKLGTPAE